jgi:hypothetical protein
MNAGASTSYPTRSPAAVASASLCIVDDFSRECLATVIDISLSGGGIALSEKNLEAASAPESFQPGKTADNG